MEQGPRTSSVPPQPGAKRPWYRSSTAWIFIGLALGVLLGGFLPEDRYPFAFALFKFFSKSFIALIKGLIVPLLVSTIIVGIAQTGDVKSVGRMGGKALLYFEVVTTIALFIGLVLGNLAGKRLRGHLTPRSEARIELGALALAAVLGLLGIR